MKLKYPAEAFALGVVLFFGGMKEAFAAGILIILAVTFAEFLNNLLQSALPQWSLRLCVLIGTASVCAGAFLVGFTYLGLEMGTGRWLMTFILGFLAAMHVLVNEVDGEYGDLFWESAIAWGFWILLAAVREFCAGGTVFGNMILKTGFQSKNLTEVFIGFLTSGLVLAFTNGVLKKQCTKTQSLFLVVPLAVYIRPFTMVSFGEIAGLIWTIAVPIVLFISVRETLKFSRTGKAFRGLPVEMLTMGFIYMILSIY